MQHLNVSQLKGKPKSWFENQGNRLWKEYGLRHNVKDGNQANLGIILDGKLNCI